MSYDKDIEFQGAEILSFLKKGMIEDALILFDKFKENHCIFDISESSKWNWLHQILLSPSSDSYKTGLSVKYLISQGIPINAQDVYGMTPLHYAMRSKNADAAIALLEAGADPNIPNKDGLRPLSMVGYTKDRLDVLELMLKKGGNVHNIMGDGSNRTILESWLPTENEEQWVFDIYNLMKKYAQNF